ncbi:hypothetical protein BGZ72_005769 [Mortierella alpina]|nr:hypothetical protein BGZ72_005769 [Mortierella alpina]
MSLKDGRPQPIEIPELCCHIASYLNLHDLAQLCLVSKNFLQLFQPSLWSALLLSGCAYFRGQWLPYTQGLKQNGHLVKHAELNSWRNNPKDALVDNDDYLLASTLLEHCGSNLTSLTIVDGTEHGRIWEVVMKRISNNRTLEGAQLLNGIRVLDISLTYFVFEFDFRLLLTQPEQYPEAVAVFAGVTELSLRGQEFPDDCAAWIREENHYYLCESIEIRFQDLVRLFPSVRNLTLDQIDIDQSEEEVETGEAFESAAMPTRPDYQFEILNFQYCTISVKLVERILTRSPNIRSLWIGKGLVGDADALLNSLPTLAPCLTWYGQELGRYSGLPTLLQGLPHLTGLHLSNESKIKDDVLQNLAESCPALQDLYLFNCISLTHCGMQHILRYCTQLRSLKLPMTPMAWDLFGPLPESSSNLSPISTSTVTAAHIHWACQHTLRDLQLTLLSNINPPGFVDVARQRLQSLTELETLSLACNALPVSALLDPEQSLEGPPRALYPALVTLKLGTFSAHLSSKTQANLIRSMPRLKHAEHQQNALEQYWPLKEIREQALESA